MIAAECVVKKIFRGIDLISVFCIRSEICPTFYLVYLA